MPSKPVASAASGGQSPVVLPSAYRPADACGCSWESSGLSTCLLGLQWLPPQLVFSVQEHICWSHSGGPVPQQRLPLRLSKFIQNR